MRAAAGGADLTGTGTASASSTFGSLVAANAFDDSATTVWSSTSPAAFPQWIKYDFGGAGAVSVAEVSLRAYGGAAASAGNVKAAPKAFDLQYSDDDTAWTTAFSITAQTGWGAEQRRFFASSGLVGGTKRLWRINVTANNGSNLTQINEIEMRTASAGPDQTGTGEAFADTYYGNLAYRPIMVFDNDTGVVWASQNAALPHWIAYDFGVGVTKDIVQVTIRANSTSAPKDFSIQYSSDGGLTWTTAWSVTGSTAWATETRTFTKP